MKLIWNLDHQISQDKSDDVKKNEDGPISTNYGVIVIFLICHQSGAIWKPDSRCMVRNSLFFTKNNTLSTKNLKQPENLCFA